MLKRFDEMLLPFGAFIFAAVYLRATMGLPSESTIFPRTILAALCLFGAAIVIAEWRTVMNPQEKKPSDRRFRAPLVFALALAYLIGFWLVGFAFAAPVFLAVTMILLGQPPVRSIIVALALPLSMYLLFSVVLGVSL